jgi:hypothetical protein
MADYLFINTATRQVLQSKNGEAKFFSPITAGQEVVWRIQFLSPTFDGTLQEVDIPILSLRAGIGEIDKRPIGGTYQIKLGEGHPTQLNCTAPLAYNSSAHEVEFALNNVPGRPSDFVCDEEFGSIIARRDDGGAVSITVLTEGLLPVCIGRVNRILDNFGNKYYIRLHQAPLAFDDSTRRALPDPPKVTTIQNGYFQESQFGVRFANEIQQLYIPEDFRGVYQLIKPDTFKRSKLLDRLAGINEIQEALNLMLKDEGGVVTLTNPENNIAHIEFGSLTPGKIPSGLGAQNLVELEVEVYSAPPGFFEFSLNLNSPALLQRLVERDSIEVPFEGEALVWVDPEKPELGVRSVKLWSSSLTIKRPLLWEGLATEAPRNWQQRVFPKNYIPFTRDQVLIGQQQAFTTTLGLEVDAPLAEDGLPADIEFVVDHNLSGDSESPGVVAFALREASSGRVVQDNEYIAHHLSVNSASIKVPRDSYCSVFIADGQTKDFPLRHKLFVSDWSDDDPDGAPRVFVGGVRVYEFQISGGVLTFDENPPAQSLVLVGGVIPVGGLALSVIGYGPESAFQAHTHTLQQVIGLSGALNMLQRRITDLESLAPRSGVTAVVISNPQPKSVTIPSFGEILPDALLLDEAISIASQITTPRSNESPVIVGTDLDAKQKEYEKEVLRITAEKNNEIEILKRQIQEAAKQKAEDAVKNIELSKSISTPSLRLQMPSKRGARFGMLLPALHGVPRPVSALPARSFGLYVNSGAGAIVLPGGGGRKSQFIAPGNVFGFDGRAFYAMSSVISGQTYYPKEMEVDILRALISDSHLTIGSVLRIPVNISTGFESSDIVSVQCYFNIYAIPLPSAPPPAGENLGSATSGILIGSQQIVFSKNASENLSFSILIKRQSNGNEVITSSEFKSYGVARIGPNINNGQFLLSGRLEQWDTDDSNPNASGLIKVSIPSSSISFEQIKS